VFRTRVNLPPTIKECVTTLAEPVTFSRASTTDKVDRLTPRQRARESAHFEKVRRAEIQYAVQLRKVARHVGELIGQFPPGEPTATAALRQALEHYAEVLRPWAMATGQRMIAEVSRRDEHAWFKASQVLGRDLRREVREAPLGTDVRRLLEEQVHYITSIPLEAARRVQALTVEYATGGRRYEDLVPMIMRSGEVSVNRATLIARTETAKAQAAVTQARAQYVGAEAYVWRTVRDRDVRPAHKRLEGRVFKWDDPPVAEDSGQRHHPGAFPNCRCFAEPVIPAVIT
jgi:SPP1 gp7 family putative phage head morphogenesis protein